MLNSILYVSAFLAVFQGVQAGMNLNSAQNVAVYWGNYSTRQEVMHFYWHWTFQGQNSINLVEASGGQKRLSYYCESKLRANV